MFFVLLDSRLELAFALGMDEFFERGDSVLHLLSVRQVLDLEVSRSHQRLYDERVDSMPHVLEQQAEPSHVLDQLAKRLPGELGAAFLHTEPDVVGAELDQVRAHRFVVLEVAKLLTLLHLVERRLRDVEISLVDQLRHLAIEERQQQCADVRTVDVRVGHDDDLMVTELFDVEVVATLDAAAERRDQRADLRARNHLFETRAFDVEDLSAQRKNRLEAAVSALLCAATRRIALDDINLALARILALAVCELAGKSARVEDTFALYHLARPARGLTRARRKDRLFDDAPAGLGLFFEVLAELLVEDALDDAFDLARHQFVFGLRGERRVWVLHRHDGGQSLTHVLAAERVLEVFE